MTEQHLSVPLELVNAPQTFNFMFLQFQAVCGKMCSVSRYADVATKSCGDRSSDLVMH